MAFQVLDFTVIMGTDGNIRYIQGPNGMSIPPDSGNSRYQEFLAVDTDAHLCARVTIPDPVVSTLPTDKERIAVIEDTLLALLGV